MAALKKKSALDKIFDSDDISKFVAIITAVVDAAGFSRSRFYLCKLHGATFLTKLAFYRKTASELYGVTSGLTDLIDTEIQILYILKKRIIDGNISPCILEIIYHKICTDLSKYLPQDCISTFAQYGRDDPRIDIEQNICIHYDLARNGLAHNKCVFIAVEHCNMSMEMFMHDHMGAPIGIIILRSILFMVIHALYSITKIYPGFHHYDLHYENVMLKFDDSYQFKLSDIKYLIFHANGVKHSVPYFGIIPKIIDYAFSTLPEENIISRNVDDKISMYQRYDNDLIIFFNHVYRYLKSFHPDSIQDVEKLLEVIEPNRTFVQINSLYVRSVEDKIPTYAQMLACPVFDEYRIMAPDKSIYKEFSAA